MSGSMERCWLAVSMVCPFKHALHVVGHNATPISIWGVASTTAPVASTVSAPRCKPSPVAATPKTTAPATPPCHTRQIGPLGDNLVGMHISAPIAPNLVDGASHLQVPTPKNTFVQDKRLSHQAGLGEFHVGIAIQVTSVSINPVGKGIDTSNTYPLG